MSKINELKKLLEKLPLEKQQGAIGKNSTIIYPWTGVFQDNYYAKVYALYAGKIVTVGSFEDVKSYIEKRISWQEI